MDIWPSLINSLSPESTKIAIANRRDFLLQTSCPCRQPNRNGDAFLSKIQIAKESHSLAMFCRKEKSQGFQGRGGHFWGPKTWLRFLHLHASEKSHSQSQKNRDTWYTQPQCTTTLQLGMQRCTTQFFHIAIHIPFFTTSSL